MKTPNWIFYPLLLVLLLVSKSAIAEEKEELRLDIPLSSFLPDRGSVTNPTPPTNTDPRYLVPPRIVPLQKVDPGSTLFPVDGLQTTRNLGTNIAVGAESGDSRPASINLDRLDLRSPFFQESIDRDRVYRLEYTNSYDRLKTVSQQRDIITTARVPQTILGMEIKISMIGDCLSDGSSPAIEGQLCVYTPGIATDRSSIDPNKLIPTGITQSAQFGEVVSPASLAAIRQPGFQSGADGQNIGVDLYFPNIGRSDTNNNNSISGLQRQEEQMKTPAITSGRIQQVLVSNGEQSGIGRTTRGFTVSPSDRSALNHGLQLLSLALPTVEPQLPPGKPGRSASINPNLLIAANNARLPDNSFTIYGAGWGYADNASDSVAGNPAPASYQQIWFGLSPVVDRRLISSSNYRTVGAERVRVGGGGEGGANSGTRSVLNLNGQTFSEDNIGNLYSQVYLSVLERDVELVSSTRLRETTDYYPHLSFSGNRTTHNSVLRYYTGAMIEPGFVRGNGNSDRLKAYGGIDFTSPEQQGFSYNFTAIGYLNPNPEYYSRISGSINQKILLGNNPSHALVLNTGFNYAIDGTTNFDQLRFRSGNSFVNSGVTLNLGRFSFKTSYFIPNRLPNAIDALLSTSFAWRVRDNLAISAYYTPIDRNATRSTYGISTAFKLGTEDRSPSLVLSWSNKSIDFGQSIRGDRLVTNENIFGIFFNWTEPF
jgi:hypothetical protein